MMEAFADATLALSDGEAALGPLTGHGMLRSIIAVWLVGDLLLRWRVSCMHLSKYLHQSFGVCIVVQTPDGARWRRKCE